MDVPVRILDTLGDWRWVMQNEEPLKDLFPDTWTHVENLNRLAIGFGLKLVGVDWRSSEEFANVLAFFESLGLVIRDGFLLKRNHRPLFDEKGNPIARPKPKA